MADLLGTIDDDESFQYVEESEDSEDEILSSKKKSKVKGSQRKTSLNKSFSFSFDGVAMDMESSTSQHFDEVLRATRGEGQVNKLSLEYKIAKMRENRKRKLRKSANATENKQGADCSDQADDIGDEGGEKEEDLDSSTEEEEEEEEEGTSEAASFFDNVPEVEFGVAFTDMNLSRPVLKGVTEVGFVSPTPIQAKTIPLALMGRDICACAATGTGKTAAYMLPVLERLLYRPAGGRLSRVLVLVPTRELAIQVHSVAKSLAKFVKVDFCLTAGGLDSRGQEAALRLSPDVIIATPGRLVDHLLNAPSFSLDTIEILILDEADRMLDEHFKEQMNEIIKLCPRSRQTLLFSATMTDDVEELAGLSLNKPVKVFVDKNTDLAENLQQEFIRIRPKMEEDRVAIVVALCCRSFKEQCLLFFQTKRFCHRMRIIFGLLGLKAQELHGSLTQLQRLEALREFKDGTVNFLLATDLAARGLDIVGVKTVINFNMPSVVKQYIHRVGRTARAGRGGRSVTLVGEKERKNLKAVVKETKFPVKSRVVPPDVIQKYKQKLENLEEEVKLILKEEEEEKEIRVSEMELNKAKNMIDHEREIFNRPARSWIPNEANKAGGKGKKAKVKSQSRSQDDIGSVYRAGRDAKKTNRAKRMGAFPEEGPPKKSGKITKTSVIGSFDQELRSCRKATKIPPQQVRKHITAGKFKSKKRFKRR